MTGQGPYKMGTISRLTGLSPVLLRAWERRYGLLEPERGQGGHRLYTDDDLRVLRRVQEMMDAGRSIGEIAALGRPALLSGPGGPGVSGAGHRPLAPDTDNVDRYRMDVVGAAVRLDGAGINRALDQAATVVSFETLIERVIEPAAREIGDLWSAGECTVASEHLATSIFVHRIRKLIESAETLTHNRSLFAIAGCLPGEEHQLGLLILAYFLNRNGVRVLFLGASLPFDDLRHACRVAHPDAVLLSVTRRSAYRKHREGILALVRDINHRTSFYVGGSGLPGADDELEQAGVRLSTDKETASSASRRIAHELAASKDRRSRSVS